MIRISEVCATDDGFEIDVDISGQRFSRVSLTRPFGEEAAAREDLLEWYFEQWLEFPMLNAPKAAAAANVLADYGTALFEQVFADRRAYAALEDWRRRDPDTQQIEIAGSPVFHQLHWEALRDPDRDRALATEVTLVRVALEGSADRAQSPRDAATIRVLLVTARPGGVRDVGYRTISRPLLDALRNAETPVEVDLLRPGTYEALCRQLESQKDTPYHVVHFDLHGAVLNYDQMLAATQSKESPNPLTMRNYGRGPLEAFEGETGFLSFEPERPPQQKGDPAQDLVDADTLARLLARYRVPIAILNACQSGKQVMADHGASLGARLVEAGAQNVLAMGYSVTVTAAEKMMPVLYRALFNGATLGEAVRQVRLELLNDQSRRARFGQDILLQDWVLPVLYQREEARLEPRRMYPDEETAWLERQARFVPEPVTQSGFVGRDVDVLQIERRLVAHNALLVYAGGGTGKTTLLLHLAAWWQRTGWVAGVSYFGYDEKAWTLDQIVAQLGQDVLTPSEYAALVGSPVALQQKVVNRLRATPWLVILDNLESVTAEAFAIRNELPADKRDAIRAFLAKLIGGKSRILLGARGSVPWLETGVTRVDATAADYPLTGLDADAASVLAAGILARAQARPDQGSDAMRRLMRLLDGHPLAMEVVLPNLRQMSAETVLQGLSAGEGVDLTAGSAERTRSILACVEFSHQNLEPELQALLLCLAPFRAAIFKPALENYVALLSEQPALAGLNFARFDDMLAAVQGLGLVHPHAHPAAAQGGFLGLQPTLPWFLAQKLGQPEHADHRAAIGTAFRGHARAMGGSVLQMIESRDPGQRRVGLFLAGIEFETLSAALEGALDHFEPVYSLYEPLRESLKETRQFGPIDRLARRVITGLEAYPATALDEQIATEKITILGNAATALLQLRQFDAAETGYRAVLTAIDALATADSDQAWTWRAVMYHQLGMVAQERRDFDAAEAAYTTALEIYTRLGDEHSAAGTYHQLGMAAQERRDFDAAEAAYTTALEIKTRLGDEHSAASTYHQLGRVAQERRDFDAAEAAYTTALEIKTRLGDEHSAASTYHQLGVVALLRRDFDAAEAACTTALEIKTRLGDEHSAASTYHQLGRVAQERRDFDAAEAAYTTALEIYTRLGNEHSAARTYHQLGMVAQERRDFDAAEAAYTTALEIKTRLGDEHSAASTYHQLGRVAQERRDFDAAEAAYTTALETYTRLGDEHSAASTYHQLGRVAQLRRDFDAAEAAYTTALEIKARLGDEHSAASTYHQLGIVALLRRDFDAAEAACATALEIYTRFQDDHSASIVKWTLARLVLAEPPRRDRVIALIAKAADASETDAGQMLDRLLEAVQDSADD